MKMTLRRAATLAAATAITAATLTAIPTAAEAATTRGRACNVDRVDYVIAGDFHPSTGRWSYETLNAGRCTSRSFDADVVIPSTGGVLRVSRPGRDGCYRDGVAMPLGGGINVYVTRGC